MNYIFKSLIWFSLLDDIIIKIHVISDFNEQVIKLIWNKNKFVLNLEYLSKSMPYQNSLK